MPLLSMNALAVRFAARAGPANRDLVGWQWLEVRGGPVSTPGCTAVRGQGKQLGWIPSPTLWDLCSPFVVDACWLAGCLPAGLPLVHRAASATVQAATRTSADTPSMTLPWSLPPAPGVE